MEDLLEIKSGCLEIFYLLWLWSKSCVQTFSFGVKVVRDADYVGDEYQAQTRWPRSLVVAGIFKKKKEKKVRFYRFATIVLKDRLLKNVMNPLWQMVLCISLIQEDENCLIASAAFVS